MRYVASYSLLGFPTLCGNQSFDSPEQMEAYVEANKANWKSYSLWQYEPHWSGISQGKPYCTGKSINPPSLTTV